jgi:hypothetical protein
MQLPGESEAIFLDRVRIESGCPAKSIVIERDQLPAEPIDAWEIKDKKIVVSVKRFRMVCKERLLRIRDRLIMSLRLDLFEFADDESKLKAIREKLKVLRNLETEIDKGLEKIEIADMQRWKPKELED